MTAEILTPQGYDPRRRRSLEEFEPGYRHPADPLATPDGCGFYSTFLWFGALAQAQIEAMPILTADPAIGQYDVEVIW